MLQRWQRRWFVLWSDVQLTWSIDDQPDTIPQGTLDMREILEVKSAEEITENPYSLALTGKQATFIKGTIHCFILRNAKEKNNHSLNIH